MANLFSDPRPVWLEHLTYAQLSIVTDILTVINILIVTTLKFKFCTRLKHTNVDWSLRATYKYDILTFNNHELSTHPLEQYTGAKGFFFFFWPLTKPCIFWHSQNPSSSLCLKKKTFFIWPASLLLLGSVEDNSSMYQVLISRLAAS